MTLVMHLDDDEYLVSIVNFNKVNSVATIPQNKMKITTKLVLSLTTAMTLNLFAISSAIATQKVDRDTLCRKFPLNSRCEDYSATKSKTQTYQLDRNSFCEKFPLNSRCQKSAMEVIKLKIDRSGKNDEWVRIEKQNNEVKLLHTSKAKDVLSSGILNGGLSLVPIPLPFVEINNYNWKEHQTTEVSFKSDRCKTENCIVTGKDTLTLPEDADLYGGLFTIEYQEKGYKRSLSFRIPADTEAETIDTITFESNY